MSTGRCAGRRKEATDLAAQVMKGASLGRLSHASDICREQQHDRGPMAPAVDGPGGAQKESAPCCPAAIEGGLRAVRKKQIPQHVAAKRYSLLQVVTLDPTLESKHSRRHTRIIVTPQQSDSDRLTGASRISRFRRRPSYGLHLRCTRSRGCAASIGVCGKSCRPYPRA